MKKIIYFLFLCLTCIACEKELDFEFHEIDPIVVVEGRLTNEGAEVRITRSRSVENSVHGQGLAGATVIITSTGINESLTYDAATGVYRSAFCGTPGTTYHLSIDFEGQHFEGQSTMPDPAPIVKDNFVWMKILDIRGLTYEVWAKDPNPNERNYYWYRMDRRSIHPNLINEPQDKAYSWNVFDDRGMPPGFIFVDAMCTTDREPDEDNENYWKRYIYEGDLIYFQLMTIDAATFEYYRSLRSGQSGGANPYTNLSGGCLGYFAAGSISRASLMFHNADIQTYKPFSELFPQTNSQ